MRNWDKILRLIPGYDPFATAEGATFCPEGADMAVDFFAECLKHIEGKLAGTAFMLEEWQQAIVGNLFGWKRPDGTRRFREAFIFVPRKNGKTPLAAGIANYCFFCDNEPGAQGVCAAAEKEQAALTYRHAKGMIEQEPELSSRVRVYRALRSIAMIDDEASTFKVISADADTKHGGNYSFAIIDELHAQPNRELVDVIQTSFASANRRQPLLIHITTSDFHRPSICNEKHDYASKVRDGIIKDAAFLPVIYEAKLSDDWRSPETWAKANPNLGVSVSREYLQRECQRAQDTPTYENTFKRLHLNIRTEQDVRWLQMEAWDRCGEPFDAAQLDGAACFGGLDLSSTSDITAFVLYFPETKQCLPFFWLPGESAEKRERRDRVPYMTWMNQGLIEKTSHNEVDQEAIRDKIIELSQKYNICGIGYDPWNCSRLATELQDKHGFNMMKFMQGTAAMNEPSKQLEKLVIAGELKHGGNAVLRWMASNATAKTDPSGNIKPDKSKSTEKIDGIVALAMAIGLAGVNDAGSVYETRGIRTL